jgi:hypothetical protein
VDLGGPPTPRVRHARGWSDAPGAADVAPLFLHWPGADGRRAGPSAYGLPAEDPSAGLIPRLKSIDSSGFADAALM